VTWAAPWALIGLAALPVVWWLHRRRKRPRPVLLPSLLFLRPEPEAAPARRHALDPELWLSLLAVGLLVGAAAGPRVLERAAGRTVRLVVSGGLPAAARGYRERVEDVVSRIEAALGPADRLVRASEPSAGTPLDVRPRPDTLLAAAQAGEAAWRVVVSDAAAPADSAGVTWVSVGRADAFNVGIVATALTPRDGGFELFVNVRGDDQRAATVRLAVRDHDAVLAEHGLEIPAGAHASHTFPIPRIGLAFHVTLERPDGGAWSDDLAADDLVRFERTPVRLHLDPALPLPLRRAVEDALVASLGRQGYQLATRDLALAIVVAGTTTAPPDAPWRLVLHPAPADGALSAGVGMDRVRPDVLVRDLSTAGVDLVYAPGAAAAPPRDLVDVLWRDGDGRRWPVVARGEQVVHFLPDPTRGRPSPVDTPLWPLFLDGLLGEIAGHGAADAAGYRRLGSSDDASTALGRSATDLVVPDLAASPPDVAPRVRSLRSPLLLAALLALLVLWIVPWSGRHARRPARAPGVPSAHGEPVHS
jgi:hypothetical protein